MISASQANMRQLRQALCTHCLVGVIAIGGDNRVDFINDTALDILGATKDELIGSPLDTFVALLLERTEATANREVMLDALAATGHCAGAFRLTMKPPRDTVMEFSSARSSIDLTRCLIYVRDVTVEVEVGRMKSEFLAHAAHELRTPMSSIYGFSELLLNQAYDATTQRDLLATIYQQTDALIHIINELLDLARIEARRGKDFTFEPIQLRPLVESVIAGMGIDPVRWPVMMTMAEGLPPACADEAKLRQVLRNVIGNAVKYSPAGGAINIYGQTRRADTQIGLSIADHGIGLTPEQAARVGERFYRADTSGLILGTGLGMAIVKEIIELHGGSFEVNGAIGKGTTVTLWLPAALALEA